MYLVSPLYGDQTCVYDVCENGMRVRRRRRVKWRREGEIERKGQIKGVKEREISRIQTQSSVCGLSHEMSVVISIRHPFLVTL